MSLQRTVFRLVARVAALLVALSPGLVRAQSASGQLRGKAIDVSTKKALADAVVTVSGPALQGEETVVSDEGGEFIVPVLPPGAYHVHVEREGYKPFNQDGVTVRLGQKVQVTFALVPDSLQAEEVVVDARPPTVDVGSTQAGVTVTQEFIQNLPVVARDRSFESLASTAPTAEDDEYGVSIGGSTSPENNFVVDGVRVTSPSSGVNASSMSVDFVKEVQVVTGGYMPEFGRSTGGVVNVMTKSGGNEFHGSVTVDVQPGALTAKARTISPPGSAISTDTQNVLAGNVSAELGGPIIKDKLWFFAGAQVGYRRDRSTRRINTITYKKGCPVDAAGNQTTPDQAVRYDAGKTNCPEAEQDFATDTEGTPVVDQITPHDTYDGKSLVDQFDTVAQRLQFMGKLTYLVAPNHTLTASAWVNPVTVTGPGGGNLKGDIGYYDTTQRGFTGDYSLRWNGAFLDKKLLVEGLAGWHHQTSDVTPTVAGAADLPAVLWDRPHSLVEFRPDLAGLCGANDANAAFKTCPLTNYRTGGPGLLETEILDRYQARLTGTYLLNAAGKHELKAGLDYEAMRYDLNKRYTGTVVLREGRTSWADYRRYGYLDPVQGGVTLDALHNLTGSGSLAGFVQDSWRPSDLVTLNVGVRWENQSLYGGDGTGTQLGGQVMSFNNQWMPRAGVILDPTRSGRSKIYASYGWFYQSLSLTMMDRQFPAEKTIFGVRNKVDPARPDVLGCDPMKPENTKVGGACQQAASLKANPYAQPEEPNPYWTPVGGARTPVDPNLQGQRMSEFTAGAEYEVVPEGRLGVGYTFRQIDRIIEDLSNDGGSTYFLANPGQGLAAGFPKPQRDYVGATVYFNRSFSKLWQVQASYTISWLYGNYAGLFRPETGQLDPNITSDFDLKRLLDNRTGYLPGDHRHNLKLYGSREVALADKHRLILGLGLTALSGSPTNFLGADDLYGPNESYLLPRGTGQRLPWNVTTDVAVKYGYVLSNSSVFTVGLDVYNLFNQQIADVLDERYTDDAAAPVKGGTQADLAGLKNGEGNRVTVNPNFGAPLSYSPPLAARILARWTF